MSKKLSDGSFKDYKAETEVSFKDFFFPPVLGFQVLMHAG
jgi:hypothetical protein